MKILGSLNHELMKVFFLGTIKIAKAIDATRKIIDCIDVKVDEHIEFEDKQPVNITSNDPDSNDEKVDEPFTDEDIEEPLSPQFKYLSRYVQKHHQTSQIVGDLN